MGLADKPRSVRDNETELALLLYSGGHTAKKKGARRAPPHTKVNRIRVLSITLNNHTPSTQLKTTKRVVRDKNFIGKRKRGISKLRLS